MEKRAILLFTLLISLGVVLQPAVADFYFHDDFNRNVVSPWWKIVCNNYPQPESVCDFPNPYCPNCDVIAHPGTPGSFEYDTELYYNKPCMALAGYDLQTVITDFNWQVYEWLTVDDSDILVMQFSGPTDNYINIRFDRNRSVIEADFDNILWRFQGNTYPFPYAYIWSKNFGTGYQVYDFNITRVGTTIKIYVNNNLAAQFSTSIASFYVDRISIATFNPAHLAVSSIHGTTLSGTIPSLQNCNTQCQSLGFNKGQCGTCPDEATCSGYYCQYNTNYAVGGPWSDCGNDVCCCLNSLKCGDSYQECSSRCSPQGCEGLWSCADTCTSLGYTDYMCGSGPANGTCAGTTCRYMVKESMTGWWSDCGAQTCNCYNSYQNCGSTNLQCLAYCFSTGCNITTVTTTIPTNFTQPISPINETEWRENGFGWILFFFTPIGLTTMLCIGIGAVVGRFAGVEFGIAAFCFLLFIMVVFSGMFPTWLVVIFILLAAGIVVYFTRGIFIGK